MLKRAWQNVSNLLMDWENQYYRNITLRKAICRFIANPIEIPVSFIIEFEKTIENSHRNMKYH